MCRSERYDTDEANRLFYTLESLVRDQEAIANTTEDINEFARYDAEFHQRIVRFLDNSVISDTFEALHYQMSTQTILSLGTEDRLKNTVKEHRAVLDRMKAGDVWGSYNAALDHIGKAQTLIDIE